MRCIALAACLSFHSCLVCNRERSRPMRETTVTNRGWTSSWAGQNVQCRPRRDQGRSASSCTRTHARERQVWGDTLPALQLRAMRLPPTLPCSCEYVTTATNRGWTSSWADQNVKWRLRRDQSRSARPEPTCMRCKHARLHCSQVIDPHILDACLHAMLRVTDRIALGVSRVDGRSARSRKGRVHACW